MFLCLAAGQGAAQAETTRADQERLFAATLREPANYELTFEYVRACAALGDNEAAIGALERLLNYNPRLTRAKFELGSLYFRLGSYETAVRYFKDALASDDLDPATRARIEAYLPEAEKRLSPSQWTGLLQTGLRYQSNVSALPDTGTLQVLGSNLPVGPNQLKKSDWNAFEIAQISHDYDFQNQRGDTFETRFTGYGTQQFQLTQFNLGYMEASLGPRLALAPDQLPGVTIKPYIAGNLSWIGGSQYLNSGGAGVSLRAPVTGNWTIEPGVEWRQISVHNPGFLIGTALGSGDLVTGALATSYRFNDWITFEGRGIFEGAHAFNAWQSFFQGGFEAALRVEFDPPGDLLPRRWTVMPYARVLWANFDAPDPFVNAALKRSDTDWRTGVLLDMPINGWFGVAAMFQYARTDSNIINYKTDDLSVMIGPNARF
jgi:Tetratricopeptide repeat